MRPFFMGKKMDLDEVRKQISYDPEEGAFMWMARRQGRRLEKVGCVIQNGYVMICIDRIQHCAHRLAWAMHYSVVPDGDIDHIDGNRANNKIANLRLAAGSENNYNSGLNSNNTSGVKGVFWNKRRNHWVAYIGNKGKQIYLGSFDNIDDASSAYICAAKKYAGDFANPASLEDERPKYKNFNKKQQGGSNGAR